MSEDDPIGEVVARALDREVGQPSDGDILRLYLQLPTVITSYDRPVPRQLKVRSSFEAAFTDALNVSNGGTSWIGAIGYLCFLDQLGGALRRRDRTPTAANDLETALELFADLAASDRAALYALRCSLAHDYSLANLADNVGAGRRHLYRHHFQLWPARQREELVTLPTEPWDGNVWFVNDTQVDLGRLEDLAHLVRDEVLDLHHRGLLILALPAAEIRRRYFFVQGAELDEIG